MKQTPFHDTRYKALFSCPEVMRDLLQEYVPGEWLKEVKFETLERKNASFVSTNDKQRHSDMVWRVDIGG
ncbi:MAG: Rpn family recombination-promoting nuclease/putative transposase, partial [Betaproteobacteria bacterium]|nr:Rpn family recombination-promoting nuclease/putative transposase [Betaproteobacteria bacterium]